MEPEGSLPHSQASATRIVLSPEEASCMWVFLNMNVLQGRVVSTSPNPQAGGPPFVGCLWLLIQFIRSYPPYRRPFLYPQPEDAPCRGDRDPLHRGKPNTKYKTRQQCLNFSVNNRKSIGANLHFPTDRCDFKASAPFKAAFPLVIWRIRGGIDTVKPCLGIIWLAGSWAPNTQEVLLYIAVFSLRPHFGAIKPWLKPSNALKMC